MAGVVFSANTSERKDLRKMRFTIVKKSGKSDFPDEIDPDEVHTEGVNRYERDPRARAKCVKHYGAVCQVCGFDFAVRFGSLGDGFIHVHHVVPLGTIRKGYTVDPVKDLRPVCPNCHAMLHRQSPPLGSRNSSCYCGDRIHRPELTLN